VCSIEEEHILHKNVYVLTVQVYNSDVLYNTNLCHTSTGHPVAKLGVVPETGYFACQLIKSKHVNYVAYRITTNSTGQLFPNQLKQ